MKTSTTSSTFYPLLLDFTVHLHSKICTEMFPNITPASYVLLNKQTSEIWHTVQRDVRSIPQPYIPVLYYSRIIWHTHAVQTFAVGCVYLCTETHTRTNSKRCAGESPRQLICFHPAKLHFSAFPCIRICQHRRSAVMLSKQSAAISATQTQCTHVKGHLGLMTSQMAFVPVAWSGGFALCVCVCE